MMVCARCRRVMKPVKNGVLVEEQAPFGPRGIWRANAYECASCSALVVTEFGARPLWEHSEGPRARPEGPIFARF